MEREEVGLGREWPPCGGREVAEDVGLTCRPHMSGQCQNWVKTTVGISLY
jgi:hypothetical protein